MSRASLLVVVLASACVKIPEFKGGGDGGSDGMTSGDATSDAPTGEIVGARAVMNGASVFVELPGLYEMQFSEQAYRYPYSWAIGPMPSELTHVLHGPTNQSCKLERDMGMTFYPAHVLASVPTTGATAATADLVIDLPGPIAKVRTAWSATLTCGSIINGVTTYTFFPNGRISRMDWAKMPNTTASNTCECEADANWHIGGYAVFKRATTDVGMAYPAESNFTGTSFNGPQCVSSTANKFRIGVGWKNAKGHRLRAPDGDSYALVGDLVASAASLGGDAPADHLGDTTTTYLVSLTENCTQLKTKVQPFSEDPQIELVTVNGPEAAGMSQDGIYGGETAFSTSFGNDVGAPEVTINPKNGDVPPFGLWLEFGIYARTSAPTVMKSPVMPSQPWYTLQRPTASQYLFWFPDGLHIGESIVIRTE